MTRRRIPRSPASGSAAPASAARRTLEPGAGPIPRLRVRRPPTTDQIIDAALDDRLLVRDPVTRGRCRRRPTPRQFCAGRWRRATAVARRGAGRRLRGKDATARVGRGDLFALAAGTILALLLSATTSPPRSRSTELDGTVAAKLISSPPSPAPTRSSSAYWCQGENRGSARGGGEVPRKGSILARASRRERCERSRSNRRGSRSARICLSELMVRRDLSRTTLRPSAHPLRVPTVLRYARSLPQARQATGIPTEKKIVVAGSAAASGMPASHPSGVCGTAVVAPAGGLRPERARRRRLGPSLRSRNLVGDLRAVDSLAVAHPPRLDPVLDRAELDVGRADLQQNPASDAELLAGLV